VAWARVPTARPMIRQEHFRLRLRWFVRRDEQVNTSSRYSRARLE
jgi:hypothetical protein